MSKIEVNQISSQCGSTLTIGQSGDTIQLACGATQTGFGRTGTVDWDTTAKTSAFTAVSGNGYFVNTTSGAITVTLPASPSAGDIVAIADYASTFNTNNVTVDRNSSNINGSASNIIISLNGKSITLVYVDGTQGWKITDNADQSTEGPAFVTATGGTVTTCGDYKIHTFTGPGTFCVSCGGNTQGSNTVSYVVVAGGGSGGGAGNPTGGGTGGGAGGAGGFREGKASSDCYTASPLNGPAGLPVTATAYPITVGGGGAAGSPTINPGTNGSTSTFSTISSAGGGYGASGGSGTPGPAASGGSGGGAGGANNPVAGTGNTPPVSPPQGNDGGTGGGSSPSYGGGGGGGATAVGANGTPSNGGNGGAGATTSITGSPVAYAGGGGGGADTRLTPGAPAGTGGTGGGGNGVGASGCAGSGTANTGGGGGGGHGDGVPNGCKPGGNGGSGIVVIRYKFQ